MFINQIVISNESTQNIFERNVSYQQSNFNFLITLMKESDTNKEFLKMSMYEY